MRESVYSIGYVRRLREGRTAVDANTSLPKLFALALLWHRFFALVSGAQYVDICRLIYTQAAVARYVLRTFVIIADAPREKHVFKLYLVGVVCNGQLLAASFLYYSKH